MEEEALQESEYTLKIISAHTAVECHLPSTVITRCLHYIKLSQVHQSLGKQYHLMVTIWTPGLVKVITCLSHVLDK